MTTEPRSLFCLVLHFLSFSLLLPGTTWNSFVWFGLVWFGLFLFLFLFVFFFQVLLSLFCLVLHFLSLPLSSRYHLDLVGLVLTDLSCCGMCVADGALQALLFGDHSRCPMSAQACRPPRQDAWLIPDPLLPYVPPALRLRSSCVRLEQPVAPLESLWVEG